MVSTKSTLPNDEREAQDSAYNPGEQHARELAGSHESIPGYNRSADGLDDHPVSAGDSSDIRSAEENGDADLNNGFYKPSEGGKKQKASFSGFFKKKGPIAAILSILGIGGGTLSIMFSPGIGIVQLKEVLMGDLNDQLTAFDIRSDHMFKAKLKSLQASASVCSNVVKIRCQFSSMSKRQIEKFRKAGFQINTADAAFGRQKISSMVAPNGVTINDPQDLINQRRDPLVRSALNKVHNPLYASLSDATALKVLKERFKTSKAKKLAGITTEELGESLAANSSGDDLTGDGSVKTDDDGRKYVEDESGNRVYESGEGANPDKYNTIVADNESFTAKAGEVEASKVKAVTGVVGSVAGSALKGVSIVGAADSACTVYNTARIVAAAAKATRSIQLAQYAMVFLGTADEIKAGTATPEQVEYLGNILTSTDTREMITDEMSATSGTTLEQAYDNAQARENPFYGKNAFDSPGYAVAAYNDAPTLSTRSQQYMVGGGLTGSLSSVTDSVANIVSGGDKSILRNSCSVIQSWWVRGAGLVVGIAAAVGTFGTSTVLSIGASLAVGIALPFLEAALADIIAGQVVGPDTKGVDSGDALFSGTAALLGGMAQARGLKPLESSELEGYLAKTDEVKSEYIAQGLYEAKNAPFDVMNQYSFLGSFVRTLNPMVTSAKSSVPNALAALPKLFSSSVASVIPSAHGATTFNPDRFTKCADEGYAELGIAADVFCNVRYGLSTEELNMDTETVLNYMLDNDHVSGTGSAQSDAYKNYLKYCVDRPEGWGETGEEGTNQDQLMGKDCMKKDDELSYFRVYTIDYTVSGAMDDEEQTSGVATGEVASPVSPGYTITDDFGPRASPCSGCSTWHQGVDFISGDKAVFSIMDGEVISAGTGQNNVVTIKHPDGLLSTYWHMAPSDVLVKAGDTVTAGQQIGKMGRQGQATGVHLHIELDISGVSDASQYDNYTKSTGGYNPGKRIDVVDFMKKNGVEGY